MIELTDLTRKAPIVVPGYTLNGYSILSQISCKIPNVYWYHDGFVKIMIMVFERIFQVNRPTGEEILNDRTSDVTMEITIQVLEDRNYFHQKYPQIVREPDCETEVELFVDALVMEISMFSEAECLPPVGGRAIRVYNDGGTLCVDLEIT